MSTTNKNKKIDWLKIQNEIGKSGAADRPRPKWLDYGFITLFAADIDDEDYNLTVSEQLDQFYTPLYKAAKKRITGYELDPVTFYIWMQEIIEDRIYD